MSAEADVGKGLAARVVAGAAKGVRSALAGLACFAEVIGLRAPRSRVAHEAQLARFRQHYAAFRRLLEANDSFLRGMADFDEKLVGRAGFDPDYVREAALEMLADVRRMIESLNEITDGGHQALWPPFEAIATTLATVVEPSRGETPTELVVDICRLGYADMDRVGAKMANLGEIRNQVGLPAPDGFALTAQAYARLVDGLDLSFTLADSPGAATPVARDDLASATLVERIRNARVPGEVEQAILAAYDRLSAREGERRRVAVRSSSLGEDGLLSFAGQYETLLDVERDGLVSAWREVASSLYSRAAVHYRRMQGLPVSGDVMPVGFVTMVPAIAGGIVFSRDPARIDRGQVIVQAAAGLGVGVADGSVIPQTIEVLLGEGNSSVRRPSATPEDSLGPGYPDELTEDRESLHGSEQSLLTSAEAELLARWARKLEIHFGGPQDVEWAMDGQRRLFVLQSRPLELAHYTTEERQPVAGATLLLSAGEVVCPGAGTGVAVPMDEDGDFDTFPKGAVLVVKRPSPKFVRLMDRTAAIVADTGSTTGHMASLAREFRIPTLLGTREATKVIRAGQVVTVDAGARAGNP
jgi:pyruvate,water dikinase